jgi:YesN/AraC family two-component response regulator
MKLLKEIKIVLIEDDYLVADMIKQTLSKLDPGYKIIGKASNGKKGIELVCSLKPDIVMMDIKMPEMNGIEATKIIQENCPTPVIILTAYESSELIDEASEAGASAYLIKPLKKSLIKQSIAIALARHNDIMKIRRLNKELSTKIEELKKAIVEIKTLRGIIPICASCKKIRDDNGYWREVSNYISIHTEAEFSHGICPDCIKKLYGNIVIPKDKH